MSSLSNNQINTRSMNGLVNVQATSGTFDDLECNTINITVQGNSPTPPLLDNSTKIATTAFVLTHSSVNYVDLTTNQTIVSGVKTFNTLPQSSAVPTLGDELVNKTFTDANYVDFVNNETISGEKTFTNANTFINNTLTADTITAIGDLILNPVGSINCNGKTIDLTGGEIHKCPLIHSQNNSNIVVEALGTGDVILKTNGINRVIVADNGITTFTTMPQCSSVPTTGDDLVNKTYADSGVFVNLTTNQTIVSGIKTFNTLPQSSAVPTLGDELVNKTFTDATYVDFVNNETIGGIKTFTSLPESSAVPTLGNQLVNKTFTDATYVDFVNNESIGGLKTFTGTTTIFTNGFESNDGSFMSGDFWITQDTYPSFNTTQLGYTITKNFATTVLSDTTGTYSVVGTGQAIGNQKGVYLITCGFELTNSGSDTLTNRALVLSLTSASGTPVNAFGGWEYYDEINDSMGGAGTRFKGTLCGVYIKTTTSAQTLYLNGFANTTGSNTLSCEGFCSITRIG